MIESALFHGLWRRPASAVQRAAVSLFPMGAESVRGADHFTGSPMIEVAQTTFGNPGGNCFEACIASLLEIDIATVPYCQRFLAEYGVELMTWAVAKCGGWRPSGFWIGGIDVAAGWGHATVWKGDRMVWNPDPSWTAERTVAAGFPLNDISILAVADLARVREVAQRSRA